MYNRRFLLPNWFFNMLNPETIEEISTLVRSGFYDKEELLRIFCEEMYEPDELSPVDVSKMIDAEFIQWNTEKQNWPPITDCDRLDSAFSAIKKRRIIALQNAGYTQSDGQDDVSEEYHNHPNKELIQGFCFYHGQDLERAIHGGGLFIAFGPIDPQEEESIGSGIGLVIKEEFEKVGLTIIWDGTINTRLHLPNIVWQRR